MVHTPTPPLIRFSHSSLKDLSESSILRSFDVLIHVHSLYLYFLECSPFSVFVADASNSTFRLLIRFIFQINILSPKTPLSAFASIDLPVRKAVLLLFGTFLLGFIPHLLFSLPSAGEATYGYLHGGLVIDFIGQRPISRLRLLTVDIILLSLQLTMLAITVSTTPLTTSTNGTRIAVSSELDRAERGVTDEEGNEGSEVTQDVGYEYVTIRVGVVETIKSLWKNDSPIVRRFQ